MVDIEDLAFVGLVARPTKISVRTTTTNGG